MSRRPASLHLTSPTRFGGLVVAIATGVVLGLAPAARAGVVHDAVGDFLSTYTAGPAAGDLDVVSASVDYKPSPLRVLITATLDAPVGTTPGVLYVFGIDRGTGVAPFGSIGVDLVRFDTVVVLNGNGTGFIRLTPEALTIPLAPSDIVISGNTISTSFSASLLPSRGFTPENYTWNLWPRLGTGNNNQISDFAPNNAMEPFGVVPEPGSMTLLGMASVVVVGVRALRTRRRVA